MGAEPVPVHVSLAATPWRRARGLIGRPALQPGHAVLLTPCRSVHTWLMRLPIDIVFLDRELVVLGVAPGVRPWRLHHRRGARAVLELAAGEAERAGIGAGARLVLQPCRACCSSSSSS